MESSIAAAYRGRSILLTGSRGYLGSSLAAALAAVDCQLTLLDRSSTEEWIPKGHAAKITRVAGDVGDRRVWDSVLSGVDFVFHLAASEVVGPEYRVIPDLQTNVLSVVYLLEACRERRYRPRIVFASSANIFGTGGKLPLNEDHPDQPASFWSLHKLAAEHYFHLFGRSDGTESVCLRLANVYGPTARREVMRNVILNKLVARALEGKPLRLYANRDCLRDYVFIDDVLRALLLAGSKDGLGRQRPFYVVGSGRETTIGSVVQMIADMVGSRTKVAVDVKTDLSAVLAPMEVRNFTADCRRFGQATGWKPQIPLEQGIDLTIKAFT